MDNSKGVYTFQFKLLCLSSFLFFASFNMVLPELPNYLRSLGGGSYQGFIIGLFTLTAAISRPFSGKLADTVGRIPVMLIGAGVSFIAGMFYPFIGSVFGFLILRLFHGFSTGFKPTGTVAYVGDIVPSSRRGEAMGIFSLSGSMGMLFGPALGSQLTHIYSFDIVSYISSVLSMVSVLILLHMDETVIERKRFSISLLKITWDDVYERKVLSPTIVMVLTIFSYGVVLTVAWDYSDFLHIPAQNKGWSLSITLLGSMIMRYFGGRLSDRWGRVNILKVSTLLVAIGMTLIGLTTNIYTFYSALFIYGLAFGLSSPTIFAWAIDLGRDEHRGRAMGTLFVGLEVGIMLGSLLSGAIYADDFELIKYTFWLGGFFSFLAFLYLVVKK